MLKTKPTLLALGIVLALFLTFSCSSGDDGTDPSSSSGVSSSSGEALSSSSVETGNNPSSSGTVPSSSSIVPSSSSALQSSSSTIPSSSSLAQSSSSTDSSSSSLVSQNGVVYGTPVTYEGQTYQTVVIGTQTWFAENLNYNASGSKCYGNSESNCTTYGRLYDWSTAMGFAPSTCNSSSCSSQIQTPHRGICPSGWHIPSNADWDKLYRYADGTNGTSGPYDSPTAGKHLKAASGWEPYSDIENLDTYGFSALPGGYGDSAGSFYDVGDGGFWWSASEYNSDDAYSRDMGYDLDYAYWDYDTKSFLFSVRCLQD